MSCTTIGSKRGFTLVELLVTIAIIGILIAVLLPNLSTVQQSAKAGYQASTTQSFGKGFMDFMTLDSQGRLTTSAYDHFRDGDFTIYGWVADLVNNKFTNCGKALDPLNRSKLNEKFTDAMGFSQSGTFNTARWTDVNTYSDGTAVGGSSSNAIGTKFFGTGAGNNVYDRGYNTNFATTWHFVRGDSNTTTADPYATNASSVDPSKCPLDGDGPLTTGMLADSTFITTADKVCLLGAARIGDGSDSTINASGTNSATDINNYVNNYGAIRKVVAKVGDFTCESFTDGMAASVTVANPLYAVDSKVHEHNDIIPNCRMKKLEHPSGAAVLGGGFANCLYADGSCRRVNDTGGYGGKGDGWIGAYKSTGLGTSGSFLLDATAADEVRDEQWLGRLRSRLSAGGGSSET